MIDSTEMTPPSFSPKELELLRCLAEGLSSKQAAVRLGISVHTVDTHRRNLLRKTGSSNTVGLVVRCVRWGVV
jgi:DNA-binding CsgD family transcriptional regulator